MHVCTYIRVDMHACVIEGRQVSWSIVEPVGGHVGVHVQNSILASIIAQFLLVLMQGRVMRQCLA